MMSFSQEIKNRVLIYDGSKGYLLQERGLDGGECGELWNITREKDVEYVYKAYRDAGSDVIQTNTFPGNRLHLDRFSLGDRVYEINCAGAKLARRIMGEKGLVAGSIGPTGHMMKPYGDLSFEAAFQVFGEQVKALVAGGVDLINFETFTDISEIRAALLAAKWVTSLPVVCSLSFEKNGRLLMGTDPFTAAITLSSLGSFMSGANCSSGPEKLLSTIEDMNGYLKYPVTEVKLSGTDLSGNKLAGTDLSGTNLTGEDMNVYLKYPETDVNLSGTNLSGTDLSGTNLSGIKLAVKPNAGIPEVIDGKTVYRDYTQDFKKLAGTFVKKGVRLIGGCCGTTPEYIKVLADELAGFDISAYKNRHVDFEEKDKSIHNRFISSATEHLHADSVTGDKTVVLDLSKAYRIAEVLRNGDIDRITSYFTDLALELEFEDINALLVCLDTDFNCSDYSEEVVYVLQQYIKKPFIFCTESSDLLNSALRVYNGRAGYIIKNSSEKYDNMNKIYSVALMYGARRIQQFQ